MMNATNPNVPDVLESVARVARRLRFATIREAEVRRWAQELMVAAPTAEVGDEHLLYRGSREDVAQFVLLTDALNFCFWSDQPWEVEYRGRIWTRTFAMLAGVLRAVERDPAWLTAQRWADATDADVAEMFDGRGSIPLPERRREIFVETGTILRTRFRGRFVGMIEAAGADARRLAYLLAETFPSFRDVATHQGEPVAFLKRAQICAADLHRTWLANGFAGLHNLPALTVFADYRLPQLFRHAGMLVLDDALAARIDRGEPIPAGSAEEVELRAATIWIGRLLCDALSDLGRPTTAWELDYELWVRARAPEVTVPHHRTLTHFY